MSSSDRPSDPGRLGLTDRASLQDWVRRGRDLNQTAGAALAAIVTSRQRVLDSYHVVMDRLCADQIARLPLTTLRDASASRLNLAPLQKAGYTSVGQIMALGQRNLTKLLGVGDVTARAVLAARDALVHSVTRETSFRVNLDPSDAQATALLQALARYDQIRRVAKSSWAELNQVTRQLPGALQAAQAVALWRWWLASPARRQATVEAVGRVKAILDRTAELPAICDRVLRLAKAPPADPWPDFEAHASNYYALLGEFVDTATPDAAVQGYVDADIVAKVRDQTLDTTAARMDLRGYQSFGAKFCLAQRRVILGDEMGLGKTVEALAGLCHLAVTAPGPALIVCPASILANWSREIARHTGLAQVVIHGADRQDEVSGWLDQACLGLTTYETLRGLELPIDLHLRALVVDEAQYIKNPRAARSQVLRDLCPKADYVWFLTGTPMENSVSEFVTLVGYLRSDVLGPDEVPHGPVAFRRAVSPVYLRRNAADVLLELPERIEQDEWISFSQADKQVYQAAVRSGNLMALRQAGYQSSDSAKLERFEQLVAEAGATGLKVVAYSFFRQPLERARQAAPIACFGPLDGDMALADRQRLVDDFASQQGPALLLAQIRVGGIGFNLQAASVVILMEPQLTPAAEEQAVARSYRMGQTRPVTVYRILAADSVDEALVGMLAHKASDFDQFARRSDLAEATNEAVDVSFEGLSRELIAAEQGRDLR